MAHHTTLNHIVLRPVNLLKYNGFLLESLNKLTSIALSFYHKRTNYLQIIYNFNPLLVSCVWLLS